MPVAAFLSAVGRVVPYTSRYVLVAGAWCFVACSSVMSPTVKDGRTNERARSGAPSGSSDPEGVQAELSGLPQDPSADLKTQVTVGGKGVAEYRFAIVAGETACAAAPYSPWLPVAQVLAQDVGGNGKKRLCVIGRDAQSVEQAKATEYTWTKGAQLPVLSLTTPAGDLFAPLPVGQTEERTVTVTVSGNLPATVVHAEVAAPFAFAGGSFPGSGGTCGASISASCTVVLSFTPAYASRFETPLTIEYDDGATHQTLSNPVVGQSGLVVGQPDFETNVPGSGASGLNRPKGLAVDSVGHRLFVADAANSRVLVYQMDSANHLVDTAADFVLGQPDLNTVTPGTTRSLLSHPIGLAYDDAGKRLFVADAFGNRVLVYDVHTLTNGMDAAYVLGQANFTSAVSATTRAGMYLPCILAYDASTNYLFVGEAVNARVTVFDLANLADGMDAAFVLGQPNFTSNTASATPSTVRNPLGLAVDAENHRLFVGDRWNSRIMVFDLTALASGMSAVNVLGEPDLTTAAFLTNRSGMGSADGLVYDSLRKRLIVADDYNNRIVSYDVSTITNGQDAVSVFGQPDYVTRTPTTKFMGLTEPLALAFDPSTRTIYIAETEDGVNDNHRVTAFDISLVAP